MDLKQALGYGIPVVRVPGYSPEAVAEHAAALMLGLGRSLHRAYQRTRFVGREEGGGVLI